MNEGNVFVLLRGEASEEGEGKQQKKQEQQQWQTRTERVLERVTQIKNQNCVSVTHFRDVFLDDFSSLSVSVLLTLPSLSHTALLADDFCR